MIGRNIHKKYHIVSMTPAVGWRAWGCSFRRGEPVIEELFVVGLAVVRYAESESHSDDVEVCVKSEDVIALLPEFKRLYDSVIAHAPSEKLDKEWLIEDARSTLECSLRLYQKVRDKGFRGEACKWAMDDFSQSGYENVEDWASTNWYRVAHKLGLLPELSQASVATLTTAEAGALIDRAKHSAA